MNEIKVTFETITPLWTGDAWGESNIIRPSSIIGSLRFWFEVICYFAGITTNDDYKDGKLKGDITSDKFKKEFLELQNKSPDKNYDELVDIVLAKLGVPLPARIFGCTGWEGKIGIKKITDVSKSNDYDYYQGKLEIKELEYTKKYQNGQTKKVTPTWYFSKGFVGEFTIIFEIKNNKTKDTIFYPLLNFIENYGFLGGKWNIGYGRAKILSVKILSVKNNEKELNSLDGYKEFKFSQFNKYKKDENDKIVLNGYYSDKRFDDIINNKTDFKELKNKNHKKILILKDQISNKNLEEIIKELIKIKSQKRTKHKKDKNNNELRHKIFGTIKKGENEKIEVPQGTKILPWIYEENGELKGGFVSIAGVLSLGVNYKET